MKKATFKIYGVFDGKKEIRDQQGYIFDYGRFRFGCHKIGREWAVTEISTGMLIGLYTLRKKDIIPLLDENIELLDAIQRALENEKNKAIQQEIRKAYSI